MHEAHAVGKTLTIARHHCMSAIARHALPFPTPSFLARSACTPPRARLDRSLVRFNRGVGRALCSESTSPLRRRGLMPSSHSGLRDP